MQAGLDLGPVQHGIVLAARDKGEVRDIGEHGSCAILPIQTQQSTLTQEMLRGQIHINGAGCLAQFLSIAPVPTVSKRTEPLETVGLTDRGSRADDFAPLAPGVARSARLVEPTVRRRQVVGLR